MAVLELDSTIGNEPSEASGGRSNAKSTLEETRTERFIGISKRGLMPVPLKYYAAHTGRWGGSDSLNLQNLPARGDNGGKLKKAIWRGGG